MGCVRKNCIKKKKKKIFCGIKIDWLTVPDPAYYKFTSQRIK